METIYSKSQSILDVMKNKFRDISRELLELIERTIDEEALKVISKIAISLHDITSELYGSDFGPGLEIAEFAQLKTDSAEAAETYADGIKSDFPDFFDEK